MQRFLVVTSKPWNIRCFHQTIRHFDGDWELITEPDDFTSDRVRDLNPDMIFFPHWSQHVPKEIYERVPCICFHETDLPFGRGGSPIQNLISRGVAETKITALKMVEDYDAGPMLLKRRLSLEGGGEEVFIRASRIIASMIEQIAKGQCSATPQEGVVEGFVRRTPSQSEVPNEVTDLTGIFNHIRMLDADGYPAAFIEQNGFRYEFSRPSLKTDAIMADVKITRIEQKTHD